MVKTTKITMEEYNQTWKKKKSRHGISLDESDDEDYTVIFDENSFSYKIISVNDLKETYSDDKPLSPNPTVDYFDDLDYFKNFENEFPAIVYNNGLTSKSDLGIKPLVNSECIDEFNLIDETSLSEYDEEIFSRFNDLFNDIHPDDLKSEKDDVNMIRKLKKDRAVRLRMVYSGEGQQVFVSHAWRRLFEIRERQQAAAAGASEADEADQAAEEAASEIPAPAQAPPLPPPAPQPRTMSQRIERLEEELMDASGQTYQPFDCTLIGSSGLSFRRRVRPSTGDASTSVAPHTDAQPDP
ncbi:hypothetical protein Tco_1019421 [Tanacetum coccineum]|uniref:Uncharacterized protein n=1 Tax=Tanacetum coccineum TaxID=301880 RepID=A0ABQ5FX38_9ASTR